MEMMDAVFLHCLHSARIMGFWDIEKKNITFNLSSIQLLCKTKTSKVKKGIKIKSGKIQTKTALCITVKTNLLFTGQNMFSSRLCVNYIYSSDRKVSPYSIFSYSKFLRREKNLLQLWVATPSCGDVFKQQGQLTIMTTCNLSR